MNWDSRSPRYNPVKLIKLLISRIYLGRGTPPAEGCFSVSMFKSPTSKYGESIKLSYILTFRPRPYGPGGLGRGAQSFRDEALMKSFIEYLGCCNNSLDSRGTIDFKVTKFSSIKEVIIPFFEKYPLQGSKNLDF